MKPSFLTCEKPPLTAMIAGKTPVLCAEAIGEALAEGADAFCIQLETLERGYRTKENLSALFSACRGKPIYITVYRGSESTGQTDEECVEYLLLGLECGATLCDVIADLYDRQERQITYDPTAVARQKALIDRIHSLGGEVLMSTHDMRAVPPEEIAGVLRAQAERGADIVKMVIKDSDISELPDYLRLLQRLPEETGKKVLFLSSGPSGNYIRKLGAKLGCCTALCSLGGEGRGNAPQPRLTDMKRIETLF